MPNQTKRCMKWTVRKHAARVPKIIDTSGEKVSAMKMISNIILSCCFSNENEVRAVRRELFVPQERREHITRRRRMTNDHAEKNNSNRYQTVYQGVARFTSLCSLFVSGTYGSESLMDELALSFGFGCVLRDLMRRFCCFRCVH